MFNKKDNVMVAILIVLLVIVSAVFVVSSVKEWNSGNYNYGALSSSILTCGLLIVAVYGFHETNKNTRMQTSMDFCLSMFQTFQSEEYVKRERLIWDELEKRGERYCAIEDIEDTALRKAVYEYCELMNGVGVLVFEHMINTDMVVSYLGTNTLKTYRYIKPYLDKTRLKRVVRTPRSFPKDEVDMIRDAESMAFAHFELLVLEMKKHAPRILDEYHDKLHKARKKSNQE